MTPEQLAIAVAQTMERTDHAVTDAGLQRVVTGVGVSQFDLQVQERHSNGHRICHGGHIFLLADTAFAYACNSYNEVAVAYQNSITYVAPGHLGERLSAVATEVSRSKRSGIYDVLVTNESGQTIALFRGHCRMLGRPVVMDTMNGD